VPGQQRVGGFRRVITWFFKHVETSSCAENGPASPPKADARRAFWSSTVPPFVARSRRLLRFQIWGCGAHWAAQVQVKCKSSASQVQRAPLARAAGNPHLRRRNFGGDPAPSKTWARPGFDWSSSS
jgi:hypothetical protein